MVVDVVGGDSEVVVSDCWSSVVMAVRSNICRLGHLQKRERDTERKRQRG